MELKLLKKELEETWEGSGYSIKSIIKFLKDSNLFGWESPFDESVPIIFFGSIESKYIVINVTMAGYELLEPLRN